MEGQEAREVMGTAGVGLVMGAARWCVQQQQGRRRQQRAVDLDPPHLADRKIADAIPAAIGHRHAIQHLCDETVGAAVGDAVQRRMIQQVLPDRDIDVERAG